MSRSSTVSARPQTPSDLPFIEELVIASRENEHGYRELPPIERNKLLRDQNRLQLAHYARVYPHAHLTIIEVGSQPVGRLYVDHTPARILIVELSILPAFQGHGIGANFIESIIAEGIRTNTPVTLSVAKGNPAFHFYEKLGFRTHGKPSDTHISMIWVPPAL